MTKTIEFFYAADSAYAYLGAYKLSQIAARHGAQIVHKPMELGPVMQAVGSTTFRERTPAHIAYFFRRELKRWAEWHGVPLMDGRPTHHDNSTRIANGLIVAAGQGADADALSHALLRAHWVEDADLADSETLAAILKSVGLAADMLEQAGSDAVQAQLDANTAEAIDKAMFGSPTYVVGGDLFYGQDRLDHVDRALTKAFAP